MSLLLEQDQVIIHGVSWQTFQQLLADRGERCIQVGIDEAAQPDLQLADPRLWPKLRDLRRQ